MAKKGKNNNQQTKKVEVVYSLEYPNGITVSSMGKGKMKNDMVYLTNEPTQFKSSEAVEKIKVRLGSKELPCTKKNNKLKVAK